MTQLPNPLLPQSLTCYYCGQPILSDAWLCRREPSGYWSYYHTDTGPYGPRTYPTCSMVIAEADALVARGWKMPQGCVSWIDTARAGEAASLPPKPPSTDGKRQPSVFWLYPDGPQLKLLCQLCNPTLNRAGNALLRLQAGLRLDTLQATLDHHLRAEHHGALVN